MLPLLVNRSGPSISLLSIVTDKESPSGNGTSTRPLPALCQKGERLPRVRSALIVTY
jgi:hypothetical protein